MKKILIVFLAVFASHECAYLPDLNYYEECGEQFLGHEIFERILGGHDATPGHWPWMANLYVGEYGMINGYLCGATLISSDYVLTAAHCLKDHLSPSEYRVILGEHTTSVITGHEVVKEVSEIIIHPDYVSETFNNDIALLKFNEPVTFSNYIRPICLPSPDFPTDSNVKVPYNGKLVTYAGKTCTITGWGVTVEKYEKSDTLQELDVMINHRFMCELFTNNTAMYGTVVKEEDSKFCAGRVPLEDACAGDSGGPLMCRDDETGRYTLYGITSYGPALPCGRRMMPGVYMEVSKYVEWIGKNAI